MNEDNTYKSTKNNNTNSNQPSNEGIAKKPFRTSGLSFNNNLNNKKGSNQSPNGGSGLNNPNSMRRKSPNRIQNNTGYNNENSEENKAENTNDSNSTENKDTQQNQNNKENQNKQNNDNKEENKKEQNNSVKKDNTEKKPVKNAGGKKTLLKEGLKSGLKKGVAGAKKGAALKLLGLKKKLIVIGIAAGIILMLLLIMLILFVILDADQAYGSSYCAGKSFDISDIETRDVMTYEPGLINWNEDSGQYNFFNTVSTYTDENGFLRAGDAYVVALGTFFGTEKGVKYVVTMDSGQEFKIILGDTKSDQHTDSTHRYARAGDIIEFMTGCSNDGDYNVPKHTGDVPKCKSVQETQKIIYDTFKGKIESIALLEDDSTCNYNGEFVERTSSIYTDQKALNRILEAAPSIKNAYNSDKLKHQCVTYVRLRAVELILDSSLSEEKKTKAINTINNYTGDAWMWTTYGNFALNKALSDTFRSDSSCKNLKSGSIITYSGAHALCTGSPTGYCGHVAIIESVDQKKREYRITENYTAANGAYTTLTKKIDSVMQDSNGKCKEVIYLLEVK